MSAPTSTPPDIQATPAEAPPANPDARPHRKAISRPGSLTIHQSDLKTWMACPLRWRYQHIDNLPREQSASLTFGSIMHEAVRILETSRDLEQAIAYFTRYWLDPASLDPTYRIDYYVKGTNFKKYADLGPKILRDWWALIQWDTDIVLAREFWFDVPVGARGNRIAGTIDKLALRYDAATDAYILLVSDYKTNSKMPTYEWLEDDLQFTQYLLASTHPEFWASLPDGQRLYERCRPLARHGEWVSLQTGTRRAAGIRTQAHFNRLIYMVDQMAESVAMRIFVPTISGESCRYCDFRAQCGLRAIEED